MKKQNYLVLIVSIIIAEGARIIGSIFTTPNIATWYASLVKPALNPPNWIFGPVWTTLFLFMGVAAYLVWQRGYKNKEVAESLKLYAAQLIINVLWSLAFFGLHNPLAAFVVIIALWCLILATIINFYKISRPASLLLVPYILWVSFAAYLNYAIYQINFS